MTPLFFGERTRKLYGVYQPAIGSEARSRMRAAVICYPWGPEYTESHRAVRWLTQALAAAGVHSLRFDYYGTGDSGGGLSDGDADGWRDDIGTAIDELRDMAGVPRVSLVGLRLGALLAASVAAERRSDIHALALWDPVLSGAAYPAELEGIARHGFSAAKLPTQRPSAAGGGHDVLGYPLPGRLIEQLSRLELGALASRLPERILAMVTGGASDVAAVRAALADRPRAIVSHEPVTPCWVENWPAAPIPVKALRTLCEWLT